MTIASRVDLVADHRAVALQRANGKDFVDHGDSLSDDQFAFSVDKKKPSAWEGLDVQCRIKLLLSDWLRCRRRGRLRRLCWLRLGRARLHAPAGPRGRCPAARRTAKIDSVIDVTINMHGRPGGRLGECRRRAAWTERGLAAHAAESRRDVAALAALQQHDDDQEKAHNNVNCVNQANQIRHAMTIQAGLAGLPISNGMNTLVRKGGFEPPRLSAPPPQDGVSASSTTSAREQARL